MPKYSATAGPEPAPAPPPELVQLLERLDRLEHRAFDTAAAVRLDFWQIVDSIPGWAWLWAGVMIGTIGSRRS